MWTALNLQKALSLSETPETSEGNGVSIDSRTLSKGNVFIALKGPTHDGHHYIGDAMRAGASAAIVENISEDSPSSQQILVPDTFKALEDLGSYARTQTNAKIIGLTGSQGKTTVKEFLGFILSHFGETISSQASYNNHWGVPLSLAHLTPAAQYGVFEMGMNNPGEIAPLARQVRPHVAIITTIGEAHIGRMHNVEAIAEEKSEILCGLDKTGIAILPLDTPYHAQLLNKAKSLGIQSILTFGKGEGATVRLLSHAPAEHRTGSHVSVEIDGKIHTFDLSLSGEHSAYNACIVLLAAKALNLPMDQVLDLLPRFTPIQGRGQRHTLPCQNGSFTLIDDAYNANPSSMKAGLSVLATLSPQNNGRRIAVLGDMRELGIKSAEYHKGLAPLIEEHGVDLVFTVGEEMKHLYGILPPEKQGGYSEIAEGIIAKVIQTMQPGDVVFVKGSKGSYVSKVVDAFLSQQKKVG